LIHIFNFGLILKSRKEKFRVDESRHLAESDRKEIELERTCVQNEQLETYIDSCVSSVWGN